ncbi:MAG TPA: hypothetical protein VGB00_17715, partial [Pyrinomonadaceae bacterium]
MRSEFIGNKEQKMGNYLKKLIATLSIVSLIFCSSGFNYGQQGFPVGKQFTFVRGENFIPNYSPSEKTVKKNTEKEAGETGEKNTVNLRSRIKKCSDNLARTVLAEYGAMYAADHSQVTLSSDCIFENQTKVQSFQNRVESSFESIDGIKVKLQTKALKAFLAARKEAQKKGYKITPRGSDAAARDFQQTVNLWKSRFEPALIYWIRQGKLSQREANRLRSLKISAQVQEVLKLEQDKIYFGKNFN